MPTPLMKSFAKQSGKTSKTVEKLWKKCEKIIKKEYNIDEDSKRFYPLVVGCLKNLLDIKKGDEKIEKDEGITTANMGGYVYAKRMPGVFTRGNSETNLSTNTEKDKKYIKILKSISKKINESEDMSMDEIMSDMINFYSEKYDDSEKILECSINAAAKYLKLEESLVNNLK